MYLLEVTKMETKQEIQQPSEAALSTESVPTNVKRPYHKPQFAAYGDVRNLTQATTGIIRLAGIQGS